MSIHCRPMRDRIPAAACHSGIYLQLVPIWHVENVSRLRAAERDRRFHRRTINSSAGDEPKYEDGKLQIIRGERRSPFARMVTPATASTTSTSLESDGQWHTYPVDYTIGSKWQQAYATKLANGRDSCLPDSIQRPRKAVAELLESD